MRLNHLKTSLRTAILVTTVFLLGAGLAVAQQTINLTAAPATLTMPDGTAVPMWGYSCGTAVSGSTAACAKSNPTAVGWSPVVITVPTGQALTINLTNSLSFANGNSVPTSLTIVGQLGGGLGTTATTVASPDHSNAQGATTWPIAGGPGGTAPAQGPRVQSFSTEVAAGATTALTWSNLRPGTYLIESGTHPSIQGPMGLYGMLVVTTAPTSATAPGTAYPGVSYNAEVPILLSEIDPVQNNAVSTAVNTAGFTETAVWSGLPGKCGNPNSPIGVVNTCYPPAVNYTPLYYMINGVAFDKTNTLSSLFPTSPATGLTPGTGNVLVRFVNAGLRMHVPAIVGSQTGTTPVAGFGLIAEDGNRLPGVTRVQSEVFMAAGKTYDVMVNVPAAGGTAIPVFDRELSLSGNATSRDAGMLAYISANGAGLPPAAATNAVAVARPDTYNSLVTCPVTTPQVCPAFVVSDPAKGVIANDSFVYGVKLLTAPTHGTLTLNTDGTFAYTPSAAGAAVADSFVYEANGNPALTATVTLGVATLEAASGITVNNITYHSNIATFLKISSPGILSVDTDAAGYPLTVAASSVTPSAGLALTVDSNGGFVATVPTAGTYSFTYKAQNAQGVVSASAATVTLVFPTGSGLKVTVLDGQTKTPIANNDYRWIIEEDRTFFVDPNCTTNPPPTGCPGSAAGTIVPTFGTNFHTSYMPVVATGCTGPTGAVACETGQTLLGQPAVCDVGNGVCRTTASQQTPVDPSQVYLDPTKRYYISVLPGDAALPFQTGNASPGHGMGGAPIVPICTAPGVCTPPTSVTVLTQPTPFPPAKLSVVVFEDDFPLNGEQDAGGGIDVLATNEPGLGQFNITIFDDAGGSGDPTGQVNYDMFNQPLSNSLAGSIDPATGNDACPVSPISRIGVNDPTQTGITGTIVTCPRFESDGITLSPLAGQAVVNNMMPGRYGVVATPGADRIARGEEWLQTNTLDGQKAHDSFLKIGEAGYFQEYGPAGYHVAIGFANPKIINARLPKICAGTDLNVAATNCTNTVKGMVTTERMSRTPDERLYSSGSNDSFAFTQCYISIGDTDGEDFAFTKCAADGTFSISGLPDGTWRITVFDQWNDMLVDGLSTPVALKGGKVTDMGQIATNQWQANISTTTFFDLNGNGVRDNNEPGLTLVPTNVRFRDGSFSNFNNTDLSGNAGFNEVFPLFSWYVVETDATRYKNTGTHVVYDAGGPADGTTGGANSNIAQFMANTTEAIPLPSNLRVPGAVYCATADCTGSSIATGPIAGGSSGPGGSTGRIDPPWVLTEGWQGFSGQNNFLEFGKKPYAVGENGGIRGHVVYASTRPFDDPTLLLQLSWEPLVPNVTINLYQEGVAADGVTPTLKLVDTTKTSSFDDWAQGFRSDGVPNMNCPGQLLGPTTGAAGDLFFFTLSNQPSWLDVYNNAHSGTPLHTIPYNSQFKCYDGMHNWNQLQPAPYDGMYQFPSVTGMNPTTGKPTGTNCTACIPNPDTTDPYRAGLPMLPAGKYVVEVVVPPGYELVKEEDKNILIGDNFIAPVTVQFPGLGSAIYIVPDQAAVSSAYNPNNPQNSTSDLGRTTLPSHEADTGTMETYWPCVGTKRIVPDFISLFPQSGEVAPFAGATRNLCDRKEVNLADQTSALAKFYVFTSTHAAAHFTGVITDDFTSEFDPFSPQFGEKFAPPNLPISIKDWTGNEISRVYTDQWGAYNGLTYSTWEVNPPNPTGYSPTMMVTCMNDPGTGTTPDALFNPAYSQFCYEIPFMPGQTQYMDTPVTPTAAFVSAGYNNPDCAYPALTPAIASVNGDGVGPWVSAAGTGHTLTITALGDSVVNNNAYSGPAATKAPYNQKTVTRHYGFGGTAGTVALLGSDGKTYPLTGVGWSDTTITGTVPSGVPACSIQQQAQYGGSNAQCGELVITTSTGQKSVDTVTVTIGGKAPTRVSTTIQAAIDAAAPGDLIIVPPGVYKEVLIMWKPVRLQGVGAASSVLNANAHPEGKLTPWRAQISCLFGLATNGQPFSTPGHLVPLPGGGGNEPLNPFDPTGAFSCPGTGWQYYNGGPNNPQVDRIPLEGILGWDTTLNGNLAQLLQEPSLMGAYEGAGITVLAKGVRYPAGLEVFGAGRDTAAGSTIAHEGQFPVLVNADGSFTGTLPLTNSTADCNTVGTGATGYTSNFMCNPSRIDGLSITDSSQGGGGVFVHGWAHNLEIANNRIYNNSGTLTGGITVGQGESPDALIAGNGGDPVGFDQQPWTCVAGANTGSTSTTSGANQNVNPPGFAANTQLPYCYNTHVNVHHNAITLNSSIGDELYSSTPAGAGGVTMAVGADYYKFTNNWLCGNLSTGDGGGFSHLGFSFNGDIEHNSILFNQSTNPTVPTNGGGIIVMSAPPDGAGGGAPGTECGAVTDVDCAPGLPDGTGPGMVINANLIMGNAADSGSGGGIRFQSVNGAEVGFFPRTPSAWNTVNVTNNIIVNNVAGWDGAGVSLQDSLAVNLINNTIMSNDSTASSGVLFNTLGAPIASSTGDNCMQPGSTTSSCPQPAGVAVVPNTTLLTQSLNGLRITCPAGHPNCTRVSYPLLANNIIWQNRAFYIGVGSLGSGTLNQQNVVALYDAFTTTQAPSQTATGNCPANVSYWDMGIRGDTGPTNHALGITLAPTYSILTPPATGYTTGNLHNLVSNPTVVSQYCNGSRVPPEFGGMGYNVPPGISDATVPNPIFNLTPSATVDEGNNWINMSWGPLAMTNPATNAVLGNYAIAAGSPAIGYITSTGASAANYAEAPSTDFFGNLRKTNNAVDAGAVEFAGGTVVVPTLTTITPNSGSKGTAVSVTLTGTNLTGATAVNVSGTGVTVSAVTVVNSTTVTATFTISGSVLVATGARTVTVTTPNGTTNGVTFTVNNPPVPHVTSISPSSGTRGTTFTVTINGTNLSGATSVTVPIPIIGGSGGVTASNIVVNPTGTSLTATFTISGTAVRLVPRLVTVTTPAGVNSPLDLVFFTVN